MFVGTPTGDSRTDSSGFLGYVFTAAAGAQIDSLGFWDQDEDGLQVSHNVGLFHLTDPAGSGGYATQIAGVEFSAGSNAVLSDGYRWMSVTPVTLTDTTANAYAVMATVGTDVWYELTHSVTPFSFQDASFGHFEINGQRILSGGESTLPGNGNNLPSQVYHDDFQGYGAANIGLAVVPEPSTYAMALAGLACGGYSLFRRRRGR
jgi:hypothetical protein